MHRMLVAALVVSLAGWTPVSGVRAQAPGVVPTDAPAAQPAEPLAPPDEPDELEEPAPVAAPPGGGERGVLQQQLAAATQEREDSSNFWPWFTVGVGATAVVTGTVVGVASSFECEVDEPGCTSPPWAALTVVVGCLIGTLGAIWLVRTDREIAELELKKTQIKYDLDRLEASRERRTGLARGPASQLNLRLSF